jgi:hypothetical protein
MKNDHNSHTDERKLQLIGWKGFLKLENGETFAETLIFATSM